MSRCDLCGGEIVSKREAETDERADTRQSFWIDYEIDRETRHGPVCLQRMRERERLKEAT